MEPQSMSSEFPGSTPGHPVPEAEVEDIKACWQVLRESQDKHPGVSIAIDMGVYENACKPGANVDAVAYRLMLLSMLTMRAGEELAPFMKDGNPSDELFYAIAHIHTNWMPVGVPRQGFPFDANEFLRLLGDPI